MELKFGPRSQASLFLTSFGIGNIFWQLPWWVNAILIVFGLLLGAAYHMSNEKRYILWPQAINNPHTGNVAPSAKFDFSGLMKVEREHLAARIVRYCRHNGNSWAHFTYDDLIKFVKSTEGASAFPRVSVTDLDWMQSYGLLNRVCGMYVVSDEFVRRYYRG
ncbi:hypothetical protein KKH39_04025 [Patescibacteria group bacterium]|nr:hypothetical protein [Patescibacteria group bacterium]